MHYILPEVVLGFEIKGRSQNTLSRLEKNEMKIKRGK